MNMNRIDELCRERKWSRRKLERQAGLSVGSTYKWSESSPSTDNLKKVADALGVSIAYITGESDHRTEQDALFAWNENASSLAEEAKRIKIGIRIPVLGNVPCGDPKDVAEIVDVEEWEEIDERLAKTGSCFAIKAMGDSMSPRICQGDTMIIRLQSDADSGDIVIARINDDDKTCKKLIKNANGVILQPLNPAYNSYYFSNEQLLNEECVIIGKVVENRQRYY